MELSLNYWWLVAFLLALVRAVTWMMIVPPFSNRNTIPATATMAVASGLAVLVAPSIPHSSLPTTTPGFIGAIVVQAVTGAALGFVVYLLLAAVTTAGSLLDLAGGINLPSALDPLSLDQTPMLGQFYEQVALALVLVSGGEMAIVDGFARTFQMQGFSLANSNRVAEILVVDLATMFTSALEIAAPILVVLFAGQVLLALLSKAAPQMNVWVLGMPFQIMLALMLVVIGVSGLPNEVANLLTRALGDASGLFGGR